MASLASKLSQLKYQLFLSHFTIIWDRPVSAEAIHHTVFPAGSDDDIKDERVRSLVVLSKLCSPASDKISLLLQYWLGDAHEVARYVDMNTEHQADFGQDQLEGKLVPFRCF